MKTDIGVTELAPAPAGPYSQSRRIGDIVACSGQAGIAPDGTVVEGFEAQTRQTFANLVATLDAVGATLADVIHVRVYLTDPGHFDELNRLYAEVFSEPFPARTTVTVVLPDPLLIEIDLLAVAGTGTAG